MLPTEAGPGAKKSGSRAAIFAAVFVVLAGLGASVFVLVNRDGPVVAGDLPASENTVRAEFVVTQAVALQPVFQPSFVEGDDAFFPIREQVATYKRQSGQPVSDEAIASGLYGGTAENTCDPDRLIAYLYANPDKGEAWAAAQGIPFNQIATYIRSLDVRVLAAPAVVINNGFDQLTGLSIPVETTLDAGTAVLVDAAGNVRVRCYCGNPVTPRPPVYRPKKCVVSPALVMLEPGGTVPRTEVPTDVEISGQRATAGSETWQAVVWGEAEAQTGWTPTLNLQDGGCVTPLVAGNQCAQPGTPVWGEASDTNRIGRLGGEVRTADTTVQVGAPVIAVGGSAAAVTENGFLLIKFDRAAPDASSSAWVRTSDLTSGSCGTTAACVNSEGPVKTRAGGAQSRATGTYLVNFTGHFASEPVSSAQVSFADGTGVGWISNFYTAVADTDCASQILPPGQRVACPSSSNPYVLANASTQLVLDGTEQFNAAEIVAVAYGAVTVLNQDAPTNGRVQVQAGRGGPVGWIDDAFRPMSHCVPHTFCADVSSAISGNLDQSGPSLPGTPGADLLIQVLGIITVTNGDTAFYGVTVDGQPGWAHIDAPVESVRRSEACEDQNPPPDDGRVCVRGGVGVQVAFAYETPAADIEVGAVEDTHLLRTGVNEDGTMVQISLDPGGTSPLGWVASGTISDEDCSERELACFDIGGPLYEDHEASRVHRFDVGGLEARTSGVTLPNGLSAFLIDDANGPETVWANPFVLKPAARRLDGSCGQLSLCFPPSPESERYEHCPGNGLIEVDDQAESVPEPEATATPPPAAQPQPTAPPQPTATVEPAPEPTPNCPDADGDGVCNAPDNCRDVSNPDQADTDNDDKGDACDPCTDVDRDLHCSEGGADYCPEIGDYDNLDSDRDGLGDRCDNCPRNANTNQTDSDGDGTGDACGIETNPAPGTNPSPGTNPCPAGQELDGAGGNCYPVCSLGVMTSGGYCCPASPIDFNQIAILGCSAVCGRGLVANYNPQARGCVTDPRDPDGAIYDANYP